MAGNSRQVSRPIATILWIGTIGGAVSKFSAPCRFVGPMGDRPRPFDHRVDDCRWLAPQIPESSNRVGAQARIEWVRQIAFRQTVLQTRRRLGEMPLDGCVAECVLVIPRLFGPSDC